MLANLLTYYLTFVIISGVGLFALIANIVLDRYLSIRKHPTLAQKEIVVDDEPNKETEEFEDYLAEETTVPDEDLESDEQEAIYNELLEFNKQGNSPEDDIPTQSTRHDDDDETI